jgi:hypothetical protein
MIVGAIGPELVIQQFLGVTKDFPWLDVRSLPYENMLEAPTLAAEKQSEMDILYFMGLSPYYMAASAVEPRVPWFYLERPSGGLPFALLRARSFLGDGVAFSIDTLTDQDIWDSTQELDFKIGSIYTYSREKPSIYYDGNLIDFHLGHFRAGRTKFCITCAYVTFRAFEKKNVPVFFVTPGAWAMRKSLTAALSALDSPDRDNLRITVGIFIPEHLPTQVSRREDAMRTLENLVFTYGKKRNILMFQRSTAAYQSVQSWGDFVMETNDFRTSPLLNEIAGSLPEIGMRVGYGLASNVGTAEQYAERALEMGTGGEKHECLLFDGEKGWRIGEADPSFVLTPPGPLLMGTAEQLALTPATLSRYLQAFRLLDPSFTAADFSRALGLHPKSGRKILARFLKAGLVKIENTRAHLHRGRPEFLYTYMTDGRSLKT